MTRARVGALGLAVALVLLAASAVTAQVPVRVRGSIAKVSGRMLTIASRDNSTVEVRLADNAGVTAVVPATLSDIKVGQFLGIASLPGPDGIFRAQEVLIFPEAARGTGEGHYPWDLAPGSTMTNATVDALVERVEGPVLTLKHKDGSVKIAVPTDVPVVTFAPGDRSMLQPGMHVFIPGQQQSDGVVAAGRVLVGKDGLIPPM
jgi:hypothetical protein